MIIKENYTLNYRSLGLEVCQKQKQLEDNENVTVISTRLDYLEVDVKGWRARSLTDDIINFISEYFKQEPGIKTQEELRNNYVEAKTAIDDSFNRLIDSKKGNKELLQSAHRQAVKELKDWYHNGGKPREKVNLTVIEVKNISLKQKISEVVEEKMDYDKL